MEKKIPKATVKCLPVYLCCLEMLGNSDIKRTKSRELSEMIQVPSATIRRDFSHIDGLSRSGYGYDVSYLIEVFGNTLSTQEERRVALVGYDSLGKTLLKNNFGRNENLNVACAFDNGSALAGTTISGLLTRDMPGLETFVQQERVAVAISTVPSHHAQKTINEVVQVGVIAVLNLAPDHVSVPANASVQYIDLTTEPQTLIYFNETSPLANSPKQ